MARADNYLLSIDEGDRTPDHLDGAIRRVAKAGVTPRFCHLLSASAPDLPAIARPARALDDKTTEDVPGDWVRSDSDIPWLTLVIGAECLQLQTAGLDRRAVLDELDDAWAEIAGADDGIDLIVERFIGSLIDDRLGGQETPSAEEGKAGAAANPHFGDWWLRFFVVTALLNEASSTARYLRHRANHWGESVVLLQPPDIDEVAQADMAKAKHWLDRILLWLAPQLEELRDALLVTTELADERISTTSVLRLVERVMVDLPSRTKGVSVGDIQGMTEICWTHLAQGYDLYPTWDEMLVDLSLAPGARGIRRAYPHPAFVDTGRAVDVLRTTLEPISRASEGGYRAATLRNDRDRTYQQYADLLVAQAAITRRTRKPAADGASATARGGLDADFLGLQEPPLYDDASAPINESATVHNPDEYPGWRLRAERLQGFKAPAAVAFVTTFDVELEMALKYHHPEQPFVVALPVHLHGTGSVRAERSRATSMWLGYVVRASARRPDNLFAAVTSPTLDDWFVLSAVDLEQPPAYDRTTGGRRPRAFAVVERAFDVVENGTRVSSGPRVDAPVELPVIVRLAGSPQVKLPTATTMGTKRDDPDSLGSELRRFAGALAIDGATTPSAAAGDEGLQPMHAVLLEEHQALRLSLPEIEVSESTARGLPRLLTDLGSDGFRRYWALLGVPLSDTVSRIRLMAQLISAGLMHPGGAYLHPKNSGISLNRVRPTSRARDMLQWVEFVELAGSPGDLTKTSDCAGLSHLQHYIAHLTKDDSSLLTWPLERTECESE